MAHHARIEEVEDSDPDEMDIGDIEPGSSNTTLINPQDIASQAQADRPQQPQQQQPTAAQVAHMERAKTWQVLYPIYFDSTRTREEGRRVHKDLAVPNPLAREICDAVFNAGLQLAFEPAKIHPKDWANPGRVRVLVKENGKPVSGSVSNKHHLYIKVAEYLKKHPADEKTPMKLKIPGMPPMSKPPPPPAVPRGWKMSSILPLHSAATSGGGVSDNLFKDMMAEMSGQQGVEAGASGKSKKDKKLKG